MSGPSVAEFRAVAQPPSTMGRNSGEHWAGALYMRKLSIYVTWFLAKTPITPNQTTWLMILTGVLAGAVLALPGLGAAVGAALLIQLYLLLDCSDGELARWTGRTSITGVYLDRVGHYFAEAALLIGLGVRASQVSPDWYTVMGFAAALGAILIKAETDLVGVARHQAGKPPVQESAAEMRSSGMALARKAASLLKFHRLILGIEASLLILVLAIADQVRGDLFFSRLGVAVLAGIALLQTVLHLVSILASSRLK